MRINSGWRLSSGGERRRTEGVSSGAIEPKSFSDSLRQQEERAGQEQWNRLLDEIQRQSDRLSRSMSIRELRQYKLLIKRFVSETSRRGVGLKDTKGQGRDGGSRRYKLLDELDGQLLAMADELLESEQGRVDLLNRMGEVKGLLINLSF